MFIARTSINETNLIIRLLILIIIRARCASFVYPGSVWWRWFAVWWRHRLPYTTPSTKTNANKSSLIWQFSNEECLLCQKRPKDLTKQVTVHHSRNYQFVMINFHWWTRWRRHGQCRNDSRTCSIKIFDNEQAVDSSYSRSESPSVAESTTAATASRSDIHNATDSRWRYALSASTVIGTGQIGSPLALKKIPTCSWKQLQSLWGLLCVRDNVVI